ncbi:MAG: NERD domain-containing protein, partial [Anaerolineae bacterium]|nr:NERD domain-containing protein [Anaerolineae bacterium]
MTVKVYISRNLDGTEQNFRETYERNAALQIAKIFWRVYQPVKNKLYALIFNLQSPPADLIIISNDGMGIVDLKHIGEPIQGDEQSAWYIIGPNGTRTLIQNNHINPARQVGHYKRDIEDKLRLAATNDTNLPRWFHQEKFYTQGAVLFTSDKFSKAGIKLSPNYTAWLELLWLDNVADWAQSCSFRSGRNQGRKLKDHEIEHLALTLFASSPWTEIDGFLSGRDPYGYLFLIEGNQRKLR